MQSVTEAILVEPIRHPEALPFRENPNIHHPELGWGVVVLVGADEFRVRFQEHGIFAWFSLHNEAVALWTVERASAFAAWARRATRASAPCDVASSQ